MPDIQSPTLIIGLGGTGVAVLRKFKQRYIELYGTNQRLVKLLAIDTAQQTKMNEELLSPTEFVHLGNPPIDVSAVVESAQTTPALDWLRGTRIPAFQIGIGAGMKRFYGHIAYFFRGQTIRARIESAVQELMLQKANIQTHGGKAGFRVFMVSSLCGGTGTGMYLDVAYMTHDIVTQAGLGAPQSFGFLFLPSAFQELKGNNFWKSINANGYAALQELQYYMTIRMRPDGQPVLRMPDNQRPSIRLKSEPFQYCYLLGGVNESGIPVGKSADLYDRTAEFLFMSATSDIGAHIAAVAVDGDRCFASFGSCNLQLPQARSLQKYFLLMGREILNDIFCDPTDFAPPRFADKFAGVRGYSKMADDSMDAAAFLEEEIFIRYNMHVSGIPQAITTIETVIADIKAAEPKFKERITERALQVERDTRELVLHEINASWNLETGTIQRTLSIIDAAGAEITKRRQELQREASPVDFDAEIAPFRTASKWTQLFSKGDAKLASFKEAAIRTFEARARATTSGELNTALATIVTELQQFRESLVELLKQKLNIQDQFQNSAQAHLRAIAQEQGNLGLLDPAAIVEDDDYRSDRMGLVKRCRARDEIRRAINSPEKATISVDNLVKALFAVVDDFVEQKAFKGEFVDDDFYKRLGQSKLNLQLKQTFEQPREESYLFVNGGEEVADSIATAIAESPDGFVKPKPSPGVNPGTATFVRLIADFKLKDLVEMSQMASAYDEKSHSADAIYLDLPTHKRASILDTANEDLGPELFAFGQVLLGIMDVGQNYLLQGRRMLLNDEADPVRRRKAAYGTVLTPDIRSEIEQVRSTTAQNLGGNSNFVPWMRERLTQVYANVLGSDEYRNLLMKEKAAAEAYLSTLPVQAQTAGV